MNSPILRPRTRASLDKGLRAVTLLGRTLGEQLAWFGSWHKPKFTGRWHCTGGIFAHVMEFACGRDHIVVAARMAVRANCRKPMAKTSLISVVDDDRYFRESMQRLMRSLAYTAEAFASAADFLASPRLAETICLVADVHMPAMTGPELYRRLVDTGHAIPTILLTAYPNDVERARALNDGVVCYLRKPLDEQHLKRCLHAALTSGK